MKITSAKFIKSLVGDDDVLYDGTPQVAFIGRSNVGKSSVINVLAQQKDLARSSPTPGHTKVINLFLINKQFYLVDLPGYGFARGSKENREILRELIDWYLFESEVSQGAVVLIVDAKVGLTDLDREMLADLSQSGKNVIVLANKIDKLKRGEQTKQIKMVSEQVAPYPVIPFSTIDKTGLGELINQLARAWNKK